MCGIAGLFSKSFDVSERLGATWGHALQLSDRGPDSAGVAVYRDPAPSGSSKVSLFSPDPAQDWGAAALPWTRLSGPGSRSRAAPRGDRGGDRGGRGAGLAARALSGAARDERGAGDRDLQGGRAAAGVHRELRWASMSGSHALGHTRMATESRVTTEHSHLFSTGLDLCLVHNGSLSNHNRLRRRLRDEGIEFQTDNDSEVAAGYLTWRLHEGASLEQALEGCSRTSTASTRSRSARSTALPSCATRSPASRR